MITRECGIDELEGLIKEILDFAGECRVFLLRGDLASGKTTFVQEFSKVLKIEADVTSPTFSIQNRYGEILYHYDIYQNGIDGFLSSGLLEELDMDGYHLIEWGDEVFERVLKSYFIDYVTIDIEKNKSDKRVYRVGRCIN